MEKNNQTAVWPSVDLPPPGSGLAERASLAKLSGLVITCDPVLARITDAFKHPLVIPNRLLDGLGCWRPRQTRSKAVSDFQPGGDALVEAVRTLLWSESYSSHNGAASVLDRERGDDAQTPWEAR